MSLNPRALALQGFLLTPIAMAVQGLISVLIEEEKSRVYGRGKAKSINPLRRPDSLTREEVEAQWDLLETRLRAQAKDPAVDGVVAALLDPVEVATVATVAGVATIAGITGNGGIADPADTSTEQYENAATLRRRQEEEFLLMLCI